ncbi:T9SS type A sorting domain-containing protein [Hymenobacter aquaticus]|uniref:T9SS type A sorting domain-containing protein n=1 Tax=Hymenobacter aquaticus TaxID=1867101 RepID=A0A4Z0PVM6_9BACT|nr:T9SS type A sorting domain-containing protein [Hymenobacter aquaticus]TGE20472.1 T9SS type A sorting domain-containing protein [Hymenobacter aquaticus]
MKHLLPSLFLWLLSWCIVPQGRAQSLDPTFLAPSLYQTAIITAAAQQPDGKYIVSGNIVRVNGAATAAIVRLNNDGTLDPSFATSSSTSAARLEVLPGGQVLAFSIGPFLINGRVYPNLVKLNPDGSVASGFSAGSGIAGGALRSMLLQPDGKIVLAGGFTSFNGTPTPGLVRLNPDGSIDQAFAAAIGTGINGGEAFVVAREPAGTLLVGGSFTGFNDRATGKIVRLLSTGAHDASYVPPVSSSAIYALGIDPVTGQALVQGLQSELTRLNLDGSLDTSFRTTTSSYCFTTSIYSNTRIFVDESRRVLLARSCVSGNIPPGNYYLTRFLPNGDVDPQVNGNGLLNNTVNVLLPQANGELLVGGNFTRFGTAANKSLVRLTSAFQVSAGFQSALDGYGTITKLAPQPDGKLVVAGSFREINGQAATNLARLNPDGTPDATFRLPVVDAAINTLDLQPSGRIVIGGLFTTVNGNSSPSIARLLTDGSFDGSFINQVSGTPFISVIAAQADGGLLIGSTGAGATLGGRTSYLHRLLPNGQLDGTYMQAIGSGPSSAVSTISTLPDGRHYVGGGFSRFNNTPTESVVRLLPAGGFDPSFALFVPVGGNRSITKLVPLANDALLVGGIFSSYGGVARNNLVWLNANGSVNTTLTTGLGSGAIAELAVQPNGRILVGASGGQLVGGVNQGSLFRLLADGTLDNSFVAGPELVTGTIRSIVVQPDGKFVIGGSFAQVGPQVRPAIARLTASNVLAVSSQQLAATTQAWPVPAHGTLHLSLDAAAQPRTVQLLDALGRAVLTQPVSSQQLALPLAGLPAGLYVLRVDYAEGTVTRRVVVE